MKIQCALCDTVKWIDDHTFIAKRFRNHPLKTFLCEPCKQRIAEKTIARTMKTGQITENKSSTLHQQDY